MFKKMGLSLAFLAIVAAYYFFPIVMAKLYPKADSHAKTAEFEQGLDMNATEGEEDETNLGIPQEIRAKVSADSLHRFSQYFADSDIISDEVLAKIIEKLGSTPDLLLAGFLIAHSDDQRQAFMHTIQEKYPKDEMALEIYLLQNQIIQNPLTVKQMEDLLKDHPRNLNLTMMYLENILSNQDFEKAKPYLESIEQLKPFSYNGVDQAIHKIYKEADLSNTAADITSGLVILENQITVWRNDVLPWIQPWSEMPVDDPEEDLDEEFRVASQKFAAKYSANERIEFLEKFAHFAKQQGHLVGLFKANEAEQNAYLLAEGHEPPGDHPLIAEEKCLHRIQHSFVHPENMSRDDLLNYTHRFAKEGEVAAMLEQPEVKGALGPICLKIFSAK